jgi:hypothetical protein
LDADQTVIRSRIHKLDVIGHNIFFQSLSDGSGQAGFKIQKYFIGQVENIQVTFHFAFGGDQGGVATLARTKFLDVIGDLAMKESYPVAASEAQAAAEAEVQYSDAGLQRGVFYRPMAIIINEGCIRKGDKPSAERLM